MRRIWELKHSKKRSVRDSEILQRLIDAGAPVVAIAPGSKPKDLGDGDWLVTAITLDEEVRVYDLYVRNGADEVYDRGRVESAIDTKDLTPLK